MLNLDGITLTFSNTVRNLGVVFEADISFNVEILKKIVGQLYCIYLISLKLETLCLR